MAFETSRALEKKDNSYWTREQRVIQAALQAQKTGRPFESNEVADLVAVLQAVDDYSKGTNTAMNLIKTNYQNWQTH